VNDQAGVARLFWHPVHFAAQSRQFVALIAASSLLRLNNANGETDYAQ
jgi:hypothetical protein